MADTNTYRGNERRPLEWSFRAGQVYSDAFNEVDLDVLIEDDGGAKWTVPAYWAGGDTWRVRFAAPSPGSYHFQSRCNHTADRGLHEVRGQLEIDSSSAGNALELSGGLRVSDDHRHLEYHDGIPFFWLGDTCWMGLTKRLEWPAGYQMLMADRVAKGFTVVQIVAGLYPDMEWGDERGENEAGLPYSRDLSTVNPGYYDHADTRISYLVQQGLVPCIVGSWAYFLKWMSVEQMKRHWLYLIARWSCLPVVWCLAGEGKMPYYLSTTKEQDAADQLAGWSDVARYVRATDPMHRLITIHPTDRGRDQVDDDSVLDFEMLQTGHSGHDSLPNTVAAIRAALKREPTMPVLNSEVNYEGIMGGSYDDVQRIAFWASMLAGAAGHTYGANGIWQLNERDRPYGPSPHGNNWGCRPWDEAMRLPGSAHVAAGKAVLERYQWWRFEPHQEWVAPGADSKDPYALYAAGIPYQVRVIYMAHAMFGASASVRGLETGTNYRAKFVNPSTGDDVPIGMVVPDAAGEWQIPIQPELRDWLVILQATAE